MPFDLTTWNPRVGASGDDKYNVPGSTKLDGSLDGSNQTIIAAGPIPSNNPPLQSDVDNGSGFNQVIALYNKRVSDYIGAFGNASGSSSAFGANVDPLVTLSYINPGDKITATVVNNIFSKIMNLRFFEGFLNSSFGFGTNLNDINFVVVPTANKIILGHCLATLRKALGIFGVLIYNTEMNPANAGKAGFNFKNTKYIRNDNPFNTPVNEILSSNDTTADLASNPVGQRFQTTAGSRVRQLHCLNIPKWLSSLVSATLTLDFTSNLVSGTANIYTSSNDISTPTLSPSFDGTFYHANNFIEKALTFTPNGFGGGRVTLSGSAINTARIIAKKGARICYMVATPNDLAGIQDNLDFITTGSAFINLNIKLTL